MHRSLRGHRWRAGEGTVESCNQWLTVEGPGSFSKQVCYFISPPVGSEPSNFSMFSPALVIVCLSVIGR